MRGGSYWNDANRARSAYRNNRNPADEFRNNGFRVLLLSAPNPRQGPWRGLGPEQTHLWPWAPAHVEGRPSR